MSARRTALVALAALILLSPVGSVLASSSSGARQAGVEMTLRAAVSPGQRLTPALLDEAVSVMRDRLARVGAVGTVTRHPATVVVRMEGPAAVARAQAEAIGEQGVLDLYDLTPSLLPPSIDAAGDPVPSTSRASVEHAPRTGRGVVVSCAASTALVCPGADGGIRPAPGTTYYYLLKNDPALTRADLAPSATAADRDPVSGTPVVTIRFTPRGNRLFHAVTRVAAQRGAALARPQSVAIVVDGQLRSFPEIDYRAYPDGIDPAGAGAEITGLSSASAATALAAVLRTRELPVRLVVVSERTFP